MSVLPPDSLPRDPLAAQSLWGFLWASRERLWGFMSLRLLAAACVIPFPILTKIIVDDQIAAGNVRGVFLWTGLGVLLLAFHLVATRRSIEMMAKVIPDLIREVRARVFQKLQFMQFAFLDRVQSGRMLAKYAFDSQKIEGSVIPILSHILPEGLRSLGMTLALGFINLWLLAFLLLILPIFALMRQRYHDKVTAQNREVRLAEARLTGQASEYISAIKLVRGFGQEVAVRDSMESISGEYALTRTGQITLNQRFALMTFVLTNSMNILAVGFGAWLVIADRMTVGALLAFVGSLPVILQPINMLTQFSQQYMLGRESFHSLKELIGSVYVEQWKGRRRLEQLQAGIAFREVSFAYDGCDHLVLRNITLDIRAGEHVAFVGPSGSGKSTLVNLLLGLYAPTSGEILIDGVPQRELAMRHFRRRCAIVMQDNLLLSGTLLENIRFGKPDASMEEVHEVVRLANCQEFVERLPEGLETLVGERGVTLSGGQRQRVAIARALLRDPRLLILDEATSALDYESEKLVQEALERLAAGRTTITIAHRLSTVRKADRIIVLRAGEVLEEGSYAGLASRDGSYFRELLAAQS